MAARPAFVKVLMDGFEDRLAFPPTFVDRHLRGVDPHGRVATLVGPSVRTHRVRLTQEGELVYLSGGGWAEFVAAYELQFGWFLTFTPHGDLTYTVIVMDHTSTNRDYPLATPTLGYPVASHVIGQSSHYFRLPNAYVEEIGITHGHTQVQIVDPWSGLSWHCGLHHSGPGGARILAGWSRFVRERGVEVGDRCVLTLLRMTGTTVVFVVGVGPEV